MGLFNFYHCLQELDWSFINLSENFDIDIIFDKFLNILTSVHKQVFPEKMKTVNEHGGRILQWFNNTLREQRDHLNFLKEVHKKNPTEYLKQIIKTQNKKYKLAIKEAKVAANDNFIKSSQNQSQAVWNIINSYTKQLKKPSTEETVDPKSFNDYFTNAPYEILSKLDHPSNQYTLPTSYLKIRFELDKVSYNEVRDWIRELSSSKSCDAYGLNSQVLKSVIDILVIPLTKIINLCFKDGKFPQALKITKIIPIHKKGSVKEPCNFRPVAIVPVISKVIELAIKSRIIKHLNDNNLFNEYQFGFRKGHSTSSAIQRLVNIILETFESGDIAQSIFCDLSKAFDCVSHEILLIKLKSYGIEGQMLCLIKSYLEDRKQYVQFNNTTSDLKTTNIGIPQGSILGPLLFIIYVNDIVTHFPELNVILYADDTAITVREKIAKNLWQKACEAQSRAEAYFTEIQLSLNWEKTQRIIFSLRPIEVLGTSNEVKYLGIYLDSKLTWNSHCDQLAKKLSRVLYSLRQLAQAVSTQVLRTAYFATFQSVLSYAIIFWGHSSQWQRIFRIQRNAIRIICGLAYRDECINSFKSLNILTFPCLYILECLIYVKKNINNFSTHEGNHDYPTRNRTNLCLPQVRLKKSQNGPNFLGLKFFNKLPDEITVLPINKFKFQVKKFLSNKVYYSYHEFLCENVSILDFNI